MAEPTPVSPRGTEFMTEADTDGITSAAPTPTMIMAGSIVRKLQSTDAHDIVSNPVRTENSVEYGRQRCHDRHHRGYGQHAHARLQRRVAEIELEKLSQDE
ncbi:MAG: hypothetical protein ABSF89_15885 [Acidimicrobiales bacterium]